MTKYEKLVSDAAKAYDYFTEDELEKYAIKELVQCPNCGESEISHAHHEANYHSDECDFYICTNCGHQWGME